MEDANDTQNYNHIKAKHNISNSEIATIYIRNYAKMASKLVLPVKLKMHDFRSIISRRLNISQQHLEVFLQGKLLEKDIGQVQLYNNLIFHLVDTKRVYLPQITIYIRRIQQNALTHVFKISSKMRIQQFICKILKQKYDHIENYFLVSAGRQLAGNRTFQQQLIQNESQILIIHKIQNLKKQNLKISKQKEKVQNAAIKNETYKEKDIIDETPRFSRDIAEKPIQNINKIKDQIKQNKGIQVMNHRTQITPTKQISKNNVEGLSSNGSQNKIQYKSQKKSETQLFEQDQNNTPQQLYQTAKFNSLQQLRNSRPIRKNFDFNTSEEFNNKNDRLQLETEYEEDQEIIIQNNNAYSYLQKSKSIKEDQFSLVRKQKAAKNENNSNQLKSQPSHQVLTKYGVAPSKARGQFKRCFQQKHIENEELTGIQILSEDSGNDSIEVKEGVDQEQYSIKKTLIAEDDKQLGFKGQNEQIYVNNEKMLATISSRYDEEEMYATDSMEKNSMKSFKNPFANVQSESVTHFATMKNQQSPFARDKIDVYKIMKNMPLANSIQLVEANKSDGKSQQQIIQKEQEQFHNEQHENNSQVYQFPIKQASNINRQTKQAIMQQIEQENNQVMKKRKNKVDVKNMAQTVSPSFFKPTNLSTNQQQESKNYNFSAISGEENKKEYKVKKEQQQMRLDQCLDSRHTFANLNEDEPLIRKTSSSFTQQDNNEKLQQIQKGDSKFNVRMEESSGSSKLQVPIAMNQTSNPTAEDVSKIGKEAKKYKQHILNNISNVSSIYHQVTNSQCSTPTYEPNLNNLPSLQMRDSFTSNVKNSHGREGSWDQGSNRLSIGSIESQTLYMMELPESSGELKPNLHKVREQDEIRNSHNSDNDSNYDNILGSQANFTSGIAKKPASNQSNVQENLSENYSKIMKKKNKAGDASNENMNCNKQLIQNSDEQLNLSNKGGKKQQLLEQLVEQNKDNVSFPESQIKKHHKNNYFDNLAKISQISQSMEGGKYSNIEQQEEQLINSSHSLIGSQNKIRKQMHPESIKQQSNICQSNIDSVNTKNIASELKYSEQDNLLDIQEEHQKQANKIESYLQKDRNEEDWKKKRASNVSMSLSFGQLMKGQIVQNAEINIGDMLVLSGPFALYGTSATIFGLNKQSCTYADCLRNSILTDFECLQAQNFNLISKQQQIDTHKSNCVQTLQVEELGANVDDENLLLNYL